MSAAVAALQTKLMVLVEDHGLELVTSALGAIRALPTAPRSERKSAKYAVTYEGTLVTETERAILWWIPAHRDPHTESGQAAWIPRVLVLDMTRGDDGKLGALRTTRPVEWRSARRIGKSIDFLRGVRS